MDVDEQSACNPKAYTSSLCSRQLLAWQECADGGSEVVLLDLTFGEISLGERERDVSQFLHFLRKLSHASTVLINALTAIPFNAHCLESFGSNYCQRTASLLVCQSYFPLCDCKSGYLYLASREECERLSMNECEEEWTSARQYGIPLPNCTELPQEITSEDQDYNILYTIFVVIIDNVMNTHTYEY